MFLAELDDGLDYFWIIELFGLCVATTLHCVVRRTLFQFYPLCQAEFGDEALCDLESLIISYQLCVSVVRLRYVKAYVSCSLYWILLAIV